MLSIKVVVLVGDESQVELALSQVVGLVPVLQPGQLQLVAGRGVAQINKDKASVCRLLAAYLLKSQCFLINFSDLSRSMTLKLLCANVNFIE